MRESHCVLAGQSQRRDRGIAYIWLLFILVLSIAVIGLAVDTSYVGLVAEELQTGADASALAAARQVAIDVDQAEAAAIRMAQANRAGQAPIQLSPNPGNVSDGDVVIGHWDSDLGQFTATFENPNAVQVVVRRTEGSAGGPLRLLFGSTFGVPHVNVSRRAIAQFGTGASWDVVIVQDITGSFTEEIEDAQDADQHVLDCIRDNTSIDSRVGFVTFTGFSQLGSSLRNIDHAFLSAAIRSLQTCRGNGAMECTGTNISAGLESAIDLFPPPGAEDGIGRAIILVSDGRPEASSDRSPRIETDVLRQMAIDSADRADALGISIFTVLYNEDDVQEEADFLASLVRGDGAAFETPDAGELPELMSRVCALLPLAPRLVR